MTRPMTRPMTRRPGGWTAQWPGCMRRLPAPSPGVTWRWTPRCCTWRWCWARFRQQPAITDLACTLGITPTQLNRVCHQVLGHSALGVLHGRLVPEAQRDLAYTTRSIQQIGGGLGFADAGYFSRFFQRQTGHTPSAWRTLAGR